MHWIHTEESVELLAFVAPRDLDLSIANLIRGDDDTPSTPLKKGYSIEYNNKHYASTQKLAADLRHNSDIEIITQKTTILKENETITLLYPKKKARISILASSPSKSLLSIKINARYQEKKCAARIKDTIFLRHRELSIISSDCKKPLANTKTLFIIVQRIKIKESTI